MDLKQANYFLNPVWHSKQVSLNTDYFRAEAVANCKV